MHELSLCRSIIETIKAQSAQYISPTITAVYLEIGVLAAVEKSALQFNFDVLKKDTVAEHAVLHVTDIPGEGICDFCQITVKMEQYHESCPNCGRFTLVITKGQELRIKSMEIV